MNKAHFGLGYLTDLFRGYKGTTLLAWIEISHTEFELELENKLKIIISIDENDFDCHLLQNQWQRWNWQHQDKNASLKSQVTTVA